MRLATALLLLALSSCSLLSKTQKSDSHTAAQSVVSATDSAATTRFDSSAESLSVAEEEVVTEMEFDSSGGKINAADYFNNLPSEKRRPAISGKLKKLTIRQRSTGAIENHSRIRTEDAVHQHRQDSTGATSTGSSSSSRSAVNWTAGLLWALLLVAIFLALLWRKRRLDRSDEAAM